MPDERTPTPPVVTKRSRWIQVVLVAVAALISASAATLAARVATPTHDQPPAASAVGPTQATSPAVALSTRDRLLAIAGHLTAAPGDGTRGRYEYGHLRRWILTTTGDAGPRPMTTIVVSLDSRRWVTEDGSGTTAHIEPGPDFTLAAADPAYRGNDAEFSRTKPVTTRHPAGQMAGSIQGAIPSDPTVLQNALDTVDPNPVTPKSLILHIDGLFEYRYVDLPVRASILRILADRTDLAWHESVTDRMGRTGFAVSVDEDNLRYTLLFDRGTGRLLASEQLLIAPATDIDAPAGRVYYYTLFIDSARQPIAP